MVTVPVGIMATVVGSLGRILAAVESLGHVLVWIRLGNHKVVLKQVIVQGVHFRLGALDYLGSVLMHVLYKARLLIVQAVLLLRIEEPRGSCYGVCGVACLALADLALIRKGNLRGLSVDGSVTGELGSCALGVGTVLVECVGCAVGRGFSVGLLNHRGCT